MIRGSFLIDLSDEIASMNCILYFKFLIVCCRNDHLNDKARLRGLATTEVIINLTNPKIKLCTQQ